MLISAILLLQPREQDDELRRPAAMESRRGRRSGRAEERHPQSRCRARLRVRGGLREAGHRALRNERRPQRRQADARRSDPADQRRGRQERTARPRHPTSQELPTVCAARRLPAAPRQREQDQICQHRVYHDDPEMEGTRLKITSS